MTLVVHWPRTYAILRIGHGVKRSHFRRELVKDVEICAVLLLDKLTEPLLGTGAEVLGLCQLAAVLFCPSGLVQHADPLGELEARSLIENDDIIVGVILLYGVDLKHTAQGSSGMTGCKSNSPRP